MVAHATHAHYAHSKLAWLWRGLKHLDKLKFAELGGSDAPFQRLPPGASHASTFACADTSDVLATAACQVGPVAARYPARAPRRQPATDRPPARHFLHHGGAGLCRRRATPLGVLTEPVVRQLWPQMQPEGVAR